MRIILTILLAITLQAQAANDSEMSIGVSVISLKDKKVVLARDDQKLFTPSSTMKILTTAAALHYLGPAYRFETGFYTNSRTKARIENLIVKASGDPSLSSADLQKLVVELKQLGIREIKRNIVMDVSVFDAVAYGKGWMLGDMNEGYSAPISGISVDDNKVVFGLVSPSGLTVFPATSYFSIENKIQTTTGATRLNLSIPLEQGIIKGTRVIVEGQMKPGAPAKYDTLAVNDPVEFAGTLIAETLKKNGIAFKGKIVRGTLAKDAKLLTYHVSAPLSEMSINFMKMSNNHAAEMLVKTIGAIQSGAQGTFENGLLAIRKFLESKANVAIGSSVIADGSGLSRYNQISAKSLTDLLTYCWNDFRIGPEFVASLALMGEEGTLKNTKSSELLGNVRAKTGSMTNLRSLAGYMKKEDGEVLAFAILTNGGGREKQQAAIDEILTSLKKSL